VVVLRRVELAGSETVVGEVLIGTRLVIEVLMGTQSAGSETVIEVLMGTRSVGSETKLVVVKAMLGKDIRPADTVSKIGGLATHANF
jgi:hypothetical protein